MKIFFDTSVLVAAFVPAHPRHERAFNRFRRARSRRAGADHAVTSAHTLAELYAVLTTLPLSPRVAPATAERIIRENLDGHATVTALTVAEYRDVVRGLGAAGLAGGIVYDALAYRAATKAGARVILTLNPRDFRRVAADDGMRVEEP